jgi:hypothetical protein
MTKKFILILIFGVFSESRANVKSGFQFTFGATSLPINAVTTSASAKKDFLGDLYNPLGIRYNFDSLSKDDWDGISYLYPRDELPKTNLAAAFLDETSLSQSVIFPVLIFQSGENHANHHVGTTISNAFRFGAVA